ncbi:hypothetical protein E5206_06215 [Arthrobacter sp. PAMC25564]|uniref:hypothetical protein n=1 Tax=Arthrobacter sp. PAMC25564 TaxID=2565366 RepID=UPI0010A24C0B|nr:hypothetical protein [Arthrobacter sp. PAMC25564]QCB96571.1 hypothetical protein E5206_06215 [Arthrobacter sp. PAMC25564]
MSNPEPEGSLAANYDEARGIAVAANALLDLPDTVSLDTIRRYVETLRGRRVVIRETSDLNGSDVCGLWFGLDDMELIFHASAAQGLHRDQIILHEFSHILLNHEQEDFPAAQFQGIFPQLDGNAVLRALQRSGQGSVTEMSAEILADLLAERIRLSGPSSKRLKKFDEVFG